ncbi:MAG: recombinase family protein [Clostridia bacterium]
MSEKQKRAALYVRVSTVYQIDKDSLPVQREDLQNYCRFALGINSFEIFEDAGYSAKNTSRPSYQQMMSRIRSGEFTHLVVWKIDRISRNLLDFTAMYSELKDLRVTFVSKNEQFDTSSAIGEAMLKIILVFAELERKMTAERVSAVLLSRATDGKWNGGRCPYGYEHEKGTSEFSINPEEAKIVAEIFQTYSESGTILSITKELNVRGLKTRYGAWNTNSVWTILTNPFYYGALRYNWRNESKGLSNWSFRAPEDVIIVPGHHDQIVTKELFDVCQDKLDRNNLKKRGTFKTYKRKNVHVFAGLITCGVCGSQYSATIDRKRPDGWRPSVYLCGKRRKNDVCSNKYVSDITIGPFVLNYIANIVRAQASFGKSTSAETLQKKLLRGPEFTGVDHIEQTGLDAMRSFFRSEKYGVSEFSPPIEMSSSPESTERDLLDKEKRKVERAISRLSQLYLYDDSDMPETEYFIERKKLSDQLERIDKRIQELDDRATADKNMTDADFIAKASYYALTQEILSSRHVDYVRMIKSTDPQITKDFVNSVCSNFCILDGRVTSIRFKNGIEHRFVYKENEPSE